MNFESLEARRLFDAAAFDAAAADGTGDDATVSQIKVTEGYPGFYEIRGTAGNDAITVQVNMADATMKVNGETFANVAYIVAYGEAGNDQISITSVDGSGMVGASVAAGDGNDSVTLGLDGGVWGGGGSDAIYLMDSFRGEAYGEAGNDYISVSGACQDAQIRGGDGDDIVYMDGAFDTATDVEQVYVI
jgi:hypothetical protein